MKILWGIQGVGNGHITRSLKLIKLAEKLGHTVDIAVSGTSHQLDIDHEIKFKFKGFDFHHNSTGELDYLKTLIKCDFYQFYRDIKSLDLSSYDKIITDFEPVVAWAAKLQKKSIWGISNQCAYLWKSTPRPTRKNWVAEWILKHFAPCNKAIGLHFLPTEDRIFYPVLRDDIIQSKPKSCNYFTIYLPNVQVSEIIDFLKTYDQYEFHIFTKENFVTTLPNFKISKPNYQDFLTSIVNCRGVITAGGFQTICESMYLKKPILCIPVKGQWEQQCNASALEISGLGLVGDLKDFEKLISFDTYKLPKWSDPSDKILDIVLKS
jgi:uncharacterized protein (TIGR00661 family)